MVQDLCGGGGRGVGRQQKQLPTQVTKLLACNKVLVDSSQEEQGHLKSEVGEETPAKRRRSLDRRPLVNRFLKLWQMVKIWVMVERNKGHTVDSTDIYEAFADNLGGEIQILETKATCTKLGPQEEMWLEELKFKSL